MERRVVVTAESAITPIGQSRKEIIDSLQKGVSGVKEIRKDNMLADYIHSKVFGTIDYEIEYEFDRKFRKTLAPCSYYACQASKNVLESSGLEEDFITSGSAKLRRRKAI